MPTANTKEKLKIFITSCDYGPDAWMTHERKLRRLYELSDKRHLLTDSPDSADIILVGNVREEEWGRRILANVLIDKYPGKCFSLSDQDRPIVLSHGIYTSGTRSIFNFGRIRTGSFTLYSDDYLNPFVQDHNPSAGDTKPKEYLLSFVGRNSHPVRTTISNLNFERKDILIEDSSDFDRWHQKVKPEKQKLYFEILIRSKFSICPRGNGTSTLRLFESMQLGVAPVIVSDQWLLPRGPNWDAFSIIIKEKDVGELESIVRSYEDVYEEMGRQAQMAFNQFFSDSVYFNYVIDNCMNIASSQHIPESLFWRVRYLYINSLKVRRKLRVRSRLARTISSIRE